MLKVRSLVLTLGLLVALVFSSVASAQEVDPCFGLAQADCDVINSATMNTLSTVSSFYQTWTVDFSVAGLPDTAIQFSSTGEGPVILDLMGGSAFPLTLDQKVTVNADVAGEVVAGETGLIVVDGIMYANDGTTWRGINLIEALEQQAGGLPFDPAALMGGDMSSADPAAAAAMEQASAFAPAVIELVNVPGFLNYVRSGDSFVFTADVAALIKDPAFSATLSSLAETSPDVAQVAQIGQLLPMLLQSGTVVITQNVDTASNTISSISFTLDATVNAAMLSPDVTEPIVVTLAFNVAISRANEAFTIVAPEGAVIEGQ